MHIKYNEFGEVISVNGLTTGHHIGAPMQDALGTPDTNCAYAEEMATVTYCCNTIDDCQPTIPSGGGIIEVDELPTENIDPNAFYYLKPTVDDTIVGTWVFNETITSAIDVIDTVDKYNEWNGDGYVHPLSGFDGMGNSFSHISCISLNGEFDGDVYEDVIRLWVGYYYEGSTPVDIYAYDNGDWATISTFTFTITEEPSDEVATWLRANATKQVVDNSGYYKWKESNEYLFNDVVTPLNKPFEEEVEVVDCSGALVDNDGQPIWFTSFVFVKYDGESQEVLLVNDSDGEYSIADAGEVAGQYKDCPITFYQIPNDEAFTTWLNENARKPYNWVEYVATNPDSIAGTWVFNDVLNGVPSKNFEGLVIATDIDNGGTRLYPAIEYDEGNNCICYSTSVGDYSCPIYGYLDDSWVEEECKTIRIIDDVDNPEFKAWLKANATKIS